MIGWLHITLISAFAGLILVLLLLLIFHRCYHPSKENAIPETERGQNSQKIEIPRIHQVSHHNLDREISTNKYVSNGWSGFAFTDFITSYSSVDSARPLLRKLASASRDHGGNEIYMQKVRLNPGLKNMLLTSHNSSLTGASSVIRTPLPLPSPYIPHEAYFEITILQGSIEGVHDQDLIDKDGLEGDKLKLIGVDCNVKNSPDSISRVIEEGKEEAIVVCVGLTGGGPIELKFPGRFPGTVGFNSTGSVHLDGTKVVLESKNDEWGRPEKVIGCGYNPSLKKVFFTVGSKLVHEIHCKREEFGHPLYPTLAANTDITVLVNFGQSPFKFEPANLQRTPNLRFIRSMQVNSDVLGYEEELFSMRRIGSQWRILHRSGTVRSNKMKTVNSIKGMEFDKESESDLFEIVLDSTTGRSPSTQTYHQ